MATHNFTLPSITIPDDWAFDGRYPTFNIPTSAGNIGVEAVYRKFYCVGSPALLVAGGLIKQEWLPGLPGNNKISQRVVFGKNGPSLIGGNLRGTSIPEKLITIIRKSRHTYCVEVPTTPEQEAVIRKAIEDHEQETERAKVEAELPKYSLKTPARFREYCLIFADTCASFFLEHSEFQFSDDANILIENAFADLRNAIVNGEIVGEKTKYRRDGNVIYLA